MYVPIPQRILLTIWLLPKSILQIQVMRAALSVYATVVIVVR
ncbi:hypothetical protein VJJ45_08860 [Capnocytophaga gingivalis]|nr:hypothetical protein [Capnocytophaga gingivalis]MEB3014604.1 hypothetical protein [Capnocytophaga gingivalis]